MHENILMNLRRRDWLPKMDCSPILPNYCSHERFARWKCATQMMAMPGMLALWMHLLVAKWPSVPSASLHNFAEPIVIEWTICWRLIDLEPGIDRGQPFDWMHFALLPFAFYEPLIECSIRDSVATERQPSAAWMLAHLMATILLRSWQSVCFVYRKSVHVSLFRPAVWMRKRTVDSHYVFLLWPKFVEKFFYLNKTLRKERNSSCLPLIFQLVKLQRCYWLQPIVRQNCSPIVFCYLLNCQEIRPNLIRRQD